MPILCNYYLTYRCNAYCGFCHFGDHSLYRTTPLADPRDVERNVRQMRRLGVRFSDFTGGEPLLYKELPQALRAAKSAGIMTSITTNCLLYPKRAAELRGLVDLLHFSMDSPRAAEHDASRGVACFDALCESIDVSRSLGEYPDILFTVTNENFMRLPEAYDFSSKHNLIMLLNPLFGYFKDEKLRDEVLDYVESFAKRPMVYLNPSFISLRRVGGNDQTRPLCKAVSRVLVISPGNEILLPCYHLHAERVPIGDDLIAAHRSPRVAHHRAMEGRHSFCEGCTINCYFEPSFAFPTNRYSIAAVASKFKYGYAKYVRQRLRTQLTRIVSSL